MQKSNILIPILIFILVSIVYTLPILKALANWGEGDWDQFIFWNAVPRITVLEYFQFPLWNPYGNGGNVLLAHPHSSFLSPFYILVLILGPLIGLKLEVVLHLFLGMSGMYYLCRDLKLNRFSSYASSFIFMLSSIYALHIREGHMEWLAMAFFPWLFLFYDKSLENKKYLVGGIISFALIYLAGTVNVMDIAILLVFLYAIFKTIQQKSSKPLKMFIFTLLGTALLSAIKLFPMLEFIYHYPRFTIENDGIGMAALARMLLSRKQALYINHRLEGLHYWHEYGAYVGILPLLFAGIGAMAKGKKKWPLLLMGIVCLLITMGSKAPINLWKILHFFPPYRSQHCPSRYILGVIFSASIFSGIGLSYFEQLVLTIKNKRNRIIFQKFLILSVGIILLDLYLVNTPVLKKTFVNLPIHLNKKDTFQQRYTQLKFYGFRSQSAMYPVLLSNSGIINSYEVIAINRGEVKTVNEPGYQGEAYLAGNKGEVSIVSFSPNRIVLEANVYERDNLVLNQNYFSGWRAIDNGKRNMITPYKGLISVVVMPGYHRLKFYYLPLSFIIGSFVTAGFVLMLLICRKLILF